MKHGSDWASIGAVLGRSASSVKDRYRLMKDTCNSGAYCGLIQSQFVVIYTSLDLTGCCRILSLLVLRCAPVWRYLWLHDISQGDVLELNKGKGKVLPYSLPNVGPGADPGVQAVSVQVTGSHPPGGMLSLLSARPVVTFPAEEHHGPLDGTRLYCLVTEAYVCEQLVQGCCLEAHWPRFEPATFRIASERSTVQPHRPPTAETDDLIEGSYLQMSISRNEITVLRHDRNVYIYVYCKGARYCYMHFCM